MMAIFPSRWLAVLMVLAGISMAEVYFQETFDQEVLESRWVTSSAKPDYGKVELSSGATYGDVSINRGLRTVEDAHFYAVSSKLNRPFDNRGKRLVVSFSVKHEQDIECGGGYMKLLPALDAASFHGDSEYSIMFGPDLCGPTRRIHLIFHYKGKNLLWKRKPTFPDDHFTHVYTLVVDPDNTYFVEVDGVKTDYGDLENDWDFLPPKTISDPNDVKPSDWVDDAMMVDPNDKKPDDWKDVPATIPDPTAQKPDDWNESVDGVWESPHRANPEYRGPWVARSIPNPNYKGAWVSKMIPNPAYAADSHLYVTHRPIEAVGFDIWQVRAGSVFDNIIVSDDLDEVHIFVEKTWGATIAAEKTMRSNLDKQTQSKEPASDADYEATKRMYEEVAEDEEL